MTDIVSPPAVHCAEGHDLLGSASFVRWRRARLRDRVATAAGPPTGPVQPVGQAIAALIDNPYMFVSHFHLAGQLAALGNIPGDPQGDA